MLKYNLGWHVVLSLIILLIFHLGVSVQVLAILILIQLPDHAPGKTVEGGSSTWVPTIPMGDLMEFWAPGSVQLSLDCYSHLGSKPMDEISLCHSAF